jgi:hypothetical protein
MSRSTEETDLLMDTLEDLENQIVDNQLNWDCMARDEYDQGGDDEADSHSDQDNQSVDPADELFAIWEAILNQQENN